MNKSAIPMDDIEIEYEKCEAEKKMSVSNLIYSGGFILATFQPSEGKVVTVDWKADQSLAIVFLDGLISIGTQQFGDVWQQTLKSKLFPKE